jgi:hypothetical protein
LPRYAAPLWLTADVDERRGGEPTVTLRGYFAGLPVEAVMRTTARAPNGVDVTQVRGTLRGFSQRFTVESGDEATLLGCRVAADPGIPMLSDEAVKHFLVQYVERMLDRLRLAAERRTPSRRPNRPPLPAAAGADADEPTAAADVSLTGSPSAVDHDGPKEAVTLSSPATGTSRDVLAPSQEVTPPVRPARPPGSRPGSRPMRSAASQQGGRLSRDTISRPPVAPRPQAPAVPGAETASSPDAARGALDPVSGQARSRRRRRRRRGRGPALSAGAGEGDAHKPDPGGDAPNTEPESADS